MLTLQQRLAPKLQQGVQLSYESIALANLRDTLLPSLLNGELRIRDAETLVEDAV
jgi:type I restriction enzyme S subunit